MQDLGIDRKFLNATQVKQLTSVVGSYTYFADGDVLLAKITPCFENGKLGIATGLRNGIGFGSSEFFVFRPSEILNKEYLYYYLSRPDFRHEGAERMGGAVGQQRVPKEFIESYPIPVPPLLEQKRIVGILDEAFEGIATAKANAEKNFQNARALFESRLQSVFENKGEGWEEKALEELGVITSSKRIYKSEYVKDGIPFYRTKEIKELSNGKDIAIELFISKKRYYDIKKAFGVPQINDLLMSAVGTIGEIMVIENDDEFYFKDGNIVWFKEFKSLDVNYLKYALTAFIEKIKSLAIGSAYNALTIEKLNKYKISFPVSLKDQQSIVNKLDALSIETQRLESIYQQKLEALEALKKSLLHQAFTGAL